MSDTALAEQKAALRRAMLEARNAIEPVRRLELAEAIHASLYDLPAFREARSVGLYWASGSEVLTIGLCLRLWEQEERRILLPFVLNEELQLTEWRTQDPVVDASYGGMHPRYRRAAALEDVDVLVVPGLAFDERGGRLGTGTGHYDRLLARLDERTLRIGLCFRANVVPEVPAGPQDERVHYLATDTGLVDCTISNASLTG